MKWPNHTDYQDALQDLQTCFELPDLKAGQAATDMLGLPRVMSGNFASVYEITTPAGDRWAIRCFVRQVAGTQARYARLSEHLEAVEVPWLVGFEFILKGILVHGDWYPIVKMEWVDGCPLNVFVEQNLEQPERLTALAGQFRTLVKDLRQHKIAHGDFQHGNIMVTPAGDLRLVDYDGMYCPAFGKKRSPELGHANFQHPLRLADYYDESLDNFSALVIYTSLLALAAEPALWKEFYTGDNLVLTSGDYRNAQASKAFARLKASANPEVRQLTAVLRHCCASPLAMVPWFEETIAALKDGTLEKSISEMQTDVPVAAPVPGTDGWWEQSQAQTAIGTRRSPTGTRPASAAAALNPATVSASAVGTSGSRPAPILSGGSRPAPGPVATPVTGSRPAPVPLTGSRPSPMVTDAMPSGSRPSGPEPLIPDDTPGSADSGVSIHVKLAVAALVIIFLIGLLVSSARKNAAPPPPPASSETP